MNGAWMFVLGLACGSAAMGWPRVQEHIHGMYGGHGTKSAVGTARAHSEEKFAFTAQAPMERVAPLFGADHERVWSPGWDPQFVHPQPATDVRGMVFTVAHGHHEAVWVNTQLDLKNGRVQYAYVVPDMLATLITLQLTAEGEKTRVEVKYERTALNADADEHVRRMAEKDRAAGPEWEKQVNEYLGRENRK
jgi:hypothetical protein